MSRWLFPWSGSIKKRACRYLLQHYLGHFLQERLSLDQLGLDLYNGSGVIKEINLDVWVSYWRMLFWGLVAVSDHRSSHRVFVLDSCSPGCFATAPGVQQQSPASCSRPGSRFFEEVHSRERHHQPTRLAASVITVKHFLSC